MDKEYNCQNPFSDENFKFHCSVLNFLLETKNKILMFSFIVVLSITGVSLSGKIAEPNTASIAFIYLIPFFILVPFTCRVAYYRVWHIYLSAYVNTFFGNKFSFNNKDLDSSIIPRIDICCSKYNCIPEEIRKYTEIIGEINDYKNTYHIRYNSKLDRLAQWLMCFFVNFELFILSTACLFIMFVNTIAFFKFTYGWVLLYVAASFSTIFIFFISYKAYNFTTIYGLLERQWKICKAVHKKISEEKSENQHG